MPKTSYDAKVKFLKSHRAWIIGCITDKVIDDLLEMLEKQHPVIPKLIGLKWSVDFVDGRKSAELFVGVCECGQVVYNNWIACPYCARPLNWTPQK